MRTALILLLILAAAAVIGSLLPQSPTLPSGSVRYLDDHAFWGPLFSAPGFFDVYGSWWFVLVTTLLFVSLAACLFPRTRALLRTIRQRPVQARELDGFPHHADLRVPAPPEDAATAAERLLRRRRFRVARQGTAVAAEKGSLREVGSLLFHWAFFLLLLGVIVGKGTGFTGRAVVTEGTTFVDARLNYAGQLRTGRYFPGGFTGVGMQLLDFEDSYRRNGQPIDFVSRVRFLDPDGRPIGPEDVRVNHPASIDGPPGLPGRASGGRRSSRRPRGERLWTSPIQMTRDAPPPGRPRLRDAVARRDQAHDAGAGRDDHARAVAGLPRVRQPPAHRRAHADARVVRPADPVLRLRRLDPGHEARDRRHDGPPARTRRPPRRGESVADVPGVGELGLSFPELRQYSVLLISRDVGIPVVLAAAILVLVGLLPALYVSRRKVWVRAEPDAGGAHLEIGGFALQRKDAFRDEFERIVRDIRAEQAVGAEPPVR